MITILDPRLCVLFSTSIPTIIFHKGSPYRPIDIINSGSISIKACNTFPSTRNFLMSLIHLNTSRFVNSPPFEQDRNDRILDIYRSILYTIFSHFCRYFSGIIFTDLRALYHCCIPMKTGIGLMLSAGFWFSREKSEIFFRREMDSKR